MPKAATATKSSAPDKNKEVSEATFLKALDKKKAALSAAAKTKRQEGFQDDKAVLERLGLKIGESGTFNAQVSKISFSFAKNDANRPMYRLAFVIMSDDRKKNGTVVSWTHILEDASANGEVFRTEEEAAENLMADLQGLGEDTESWKESEVNAKILAACKKHTKEKTEVSLYIKHWASYKADGVTVKNEGGNYRINGPIGDDAPVEDEVAEESEEEANEEEGEFDPDEWIGGWVTFHNEEYGDVRMKVDSYDEDTDTFSGTDTNGDVWDGDYAVKVEDADWDDDQSDPE